MSRETFPFAELTPNQMSQRDREEAYEQLHDLPYSTYKDRQSGYTMLWRYDDVNEALRTTDDISNRNALDPDGGYLRLMRPRVIPHFLRHLVPLPAKATANAEGQMHDTIWKALYGADGVMRIRQNELPAQQEMMRNQFRAALETMGLAATAGSVLDISELSTLYVSRIACVTVGLPVSEASDVQQKSAAQSGLLGQYLSGRQLVTAVEALGWSFTDTKRFVRKQDAPAFVSLDQFAIEELAEEGISKMVRRLMTEGIPEEYIVSVVANVLAASVGTTAGSTEQATDYELRSPNRLGWEQLASEEGATAVTIQNLRKRPGLGGWRRLAVKKTMLPSGEMVKGPLLAMTVAANHDPSAQNKRSLSFGSGLLCPGRDIATLATKVFLQELYQRAPEAKVLEPKRKPHERERDLLFLGADVQIKM